MNIVILMPLAEQRGGGELMLFHLLRYAAAPDVKWTVVFFEDGPLVEEARALGVEALVVPTGRLRQFFRYVRAVFQIAALLREVRADLVLSWSGKPHLYGSPAALLAGVPAMWYQLGYPVGRHLHWMDRCATLLPARSIVTLSKVAQHGQRQLFPERPTPLVYPSVELERFDPARLPSPAEARRRLGLPLHRPLIGLVGRLQRWKGQHVLIEALPEILRARSDACAVLVGGAHDQEPDYEAFLERRIEALGVGEHVIRAGFQRDIPLWMQAMDVVVHASDNEPFGIVIIEAMALGKPVVAGASGGPTEIITDEVDGVLAPYDDAAVLARQVARYLRDPARAARLGNAARRRAQDFAPAKYAACLVDHLRASVGSTAAAAA